MRVEPLADARGKEQRRRRFRDLPLDLRGVVLLLGAMARRAPRARRRVRRRPARERRLQQALRDEIGKAAVRRRRMRVVVDGQPEVAVGARSPGASTAYSPAPSSLTTDERKIGESARVGASPRLRRNASSARRRASPAALRRTRARQRDDAVPPFRRRAARGAATATPARRESARSTPLAATMKSSISSFARFDCVRREVGAARRRRRPGAPRACRARARPRVLAPALQRLRDAVLRCAAARPAPAPRRAAGGAGAVALEPGGDAVVRELGVVADAARGRSSEPATVPSAVDRHLDDDRQPVLVSVERRQVGRQLLRQHREDLAPPCRPTSCWPRRGRRCAEPFVDQRVDVGDRDEDRLAAPSPRGLRDRELIEIARVVVVDRRPRELAQVAHRRLRRPGARVSALVSATTAGEKSGSRPRERIASRATCCRRRLPLGDEEAIAASRGSGYCRRIGARPLARGDRGRNSTRSQMVTLACQFEAASTRKLRIGASIGRAHLPLR